MAKEIAHSFILQELLDSRIADRVRVKPMFGSHAVYVDDKIVFILRSRQGRANARDNGLWVVANLDHVDSLRTEFPALRPIKMFSKRKGGTGVPTWNNLPDSSPNFEQDALALCELVIKGDERIGRVPGEKKKRPAVKRAVKTKSPRKAPKSSKEITKHNKKKAAKPAAYKAPDKKALRKTGKRQRRAP